MNTIVGGGNDNKYEFTRDSTVNSYSLSLQWGVANSRLFELCILTRKQLGEESLSVSRVCSSPS